MIEEGAPPLTVKWSLVVKSRAFYVTRTKIMRQKKRIEFDLCSATNRRNEKIACEGERESARRGGRKNTSSISK